MFETIINFFFPDNCIFCKTKNTSLCEECFLSIPESPIFKKNIRSFYAYKNNKVALLLKDLKYHHNAEVAKKFGRILAKEIKKVAKGNIYLIPIPLNENDMRLHNHAELIANAINENLENSRILNILDKNSKMEQNKTSSRKERIENVSGAFSVNSYKDFKADPYSNYIIIDDIQTTGSTINEAKKILKEKLNIDTIAFTVAY